MRRFIGASEGASIYIFGLCGGSILATVLTNFLYNIGTFDSMRIIDWVAYSVTQIAFILVFVGYCRLRRVDMRSVSRAYKFFNWKRYLLLPFISIATIIVFLPLSNLFLKLLGAMGFSGGVSMPAYSSVGVYFLSLLVMALMPAFGEEFLIRGALFSGLSSRGTWFGILISALLFSLMHANPVQTVHQFGLGVVLAIVLLLSGSIWACVFIHFFNNFISITVTAYIPQIDQWYYSLGSLQFLTDFLSIIIGAALLLCLLYLYYRAGEPKRDKYRVVTDGIVYEEFTVYATAEERADTRKKNFESSDFAGMFKFIGSLFTRRGWVNVTNELNRKNEAPYLGKAQPMFNVWLALGFGVFYWLLNFILGFM